MDMHTEHVDDIAWHDHNMIIYDHTNAATHPTKRFSSGQHTSARATP
jgi:hypothetical protein